MTKEIPAGLKAWKWYHIISASGIVITFILGMLYFKRNLFLNILPFSDMVSNIFLIVFFILSLVIVYGMVKLNKLAYYASLSFIILVLVMNIYSLSISFRIESIIWILIVVYVGYYIYSKKEYF